MRGLAKRVCEVKGVGDDAGQRSCRWTAGTWAATQLQALLLPLICDRLVAALLGLGSRPLTALL